MSIKKELLNELTEEQLKQLADHKRIPWTLTASKQKYYEGWNEKDKIVDILSGHVSLTVSDIEGFITKKR